MPGVFDDLKDDLKLSPEERSFVRDLLAHPGWVVLEEKVWHRKELFFLMKCKTENANESNRFWAGAHEGLRECQRVAAKAAGSGEVRAQPPSQKEKVMGRVEPNEIEPGHTSGSSPL